MQRSKTLLRTCALIAVVGIATLALPLSARAGVRVSISLGLPVVVAPPPVAYGGPQVIVGGYYGAYYRPWRHYHRWHRW
jgi:hypothetical protein